MSDVYCKESAKGQFIEKYRNVFGCKNLGEVCWCEVCVGLEAAWNDIHKHIMESIEARR